MAFQAPGDLQFKEHNADHAWRSFGKPDEIVHRDRHRTQEPNDARTLVGCGFRAFSRRFTANWLSLACRQFDTDDRLQRGNDVGYFRHWCGTLFEQAIGALGARIERGAWNGENFAALFERQPRGDQRARTLGGLDDDDAERKPGNQTIAPGKIASARFPPKRHFGHHEAAWHNVLDQLGMLGRIDAVLTAGEDGDRSAGKARAMRGRINAARQTRDGGETGFAKSARELRRDFQSRGRGIARADDRYRGLYQGAAIAAHGNKRRRVIDGLKAVWIVGLTDSDERSAEFARRLDLALSLLTGINLRRAAASATRQRGQRFERRAGAAEVIDQRAKGARARYYGANATRFKSPPSPPVRKPTGETMPHAFKAHPDHPAVPYLIRLHADIGGQIQANKQEAERLAEAAKHVEAVIRLYDPEFNARSISARRRVTGNPWFKRGKMFRHALDVLRSAPVPMTVRELTDAVMAARRITNASADQRRKLEAAMRSCLETNAGKTVQRVGEGVPKRWKISA
jgi:hypothetical protein